MFVLVWEAICTGKYVVWTVLHYLAQCIRVELLVRILVLNSMMLQLVLGARKYLTSSGFLRFLVWGAYISAGVVAISALGVMMHNDWREVYGIWAPVLLIHLGGPDAISAYSMADNEISVAFVVEVVRKITSVENLQRRTITHNIDLRGKTW
ncbi:hypothetical protein SUGI_0390620 [Cryptomeria japonica]|nr:hypothetical protein SUGI_0390620 [Cryptomeria japonica]